MPATAIPGQAIPARGQPYFTLIRKVEARWHDADDGVIAPTECIHRQRLAENLRVSRKTPLPESVTDHRGALASALVFFRQECAAQERLDAKRREKTGRDIHAP